MFSAVIKRVLEKEPFSSSEAREVMHILLASETSPEVCASILTALSFRKFTVRELINFEEVLSGLRAAHLGLNALVLPHTMISRVMDICGTGGAGKDTFNISTAAALIIASSGTPVAKHGNYGFSSACGSSDVLEALGLFFPTNQEAIENCIISHNFAYLHAPFFQPALKKIAGVRKMLKIRTVFNLLGPLLNPLCTTKGLIGVATSEYFDLFRRRLAYTGRKEAVVWSHDGCDDITLSGPFSLAWNGINRVYTPEDIGLEVVPFNELKGGHDSISNANLLKALLSGNGSTAQNAVICANAGVGLYVAEAVSSPLEGVLEVKKILSSGIAAELLNNLRSR
jgi:anthranilate phosphoribosyltransferase